MKKKSTKMTEPTKEPLTLADFEMLAEEELKKQGPRKGIKTFQTKPESEKKMVMLDRLFDPSHQGDVGLMKVSHEVYDTDKGTDVKIDENTQKMVVQFGEGLHIHDIVHPERIKLKLMSLEDGVKRMRLLVTDKEGTAIRHDEHGYIGLGYGTYDVPTQQEWDRQGFLRPVSD